VKDLIYFSLYFASKPGAEKDGTSVMASVNVCVAQELFPKHSIEQDSL